MFWDIDQINFSSCPFFYRTRVRSFVTHWPTHSCLVNLIGVALACEDDNSKIVGIVTVALFTIRNMLTTFWCRFGRWFGHKVKFLFILWAQGFKVWSMSIFAVDASCDYEVQDRFGQELVIWPKEVTLISRTQPSGPLCLWQCFENEASRVI